MTDGKDPLAALEELLGDKGKGGGKTSADDKAKAEEEKAHTEKEEEEKKLAEVHVLRQGQKVKDAEDLRQEIAGLQDIHHMPAEKVRKQQVKEKQQSEKDRQVAADKYEIRQLDHTKI